LNKNRFKLVTPNSNTNKDIKNQDDNISNNENLDIDNLSKISNQQVNNELNENQPIKKISSLNKKSSFGNSIVNISLKKSSTLLPLYTSNGLSNKKLTFSKTITIFNEKKDTEDENHNSQNLNSSRIVRMKSSNKINNENMSSTVLNDKEINPGVKGDQNENLKLNENNISVLSPILSPTFTSLGKLSKKQITIENFFSSNKKDSSNIKDVSKYKDNMAELGPYIRTKLASPPPGLKKFRVGCFLDSRTPEATHFLKEFYLRYKKESSKFEDVYFNTYLKTENKRDKDLSFYDIKYNEKAIYKRRKNYDYFSQIKNKFDQDISKIGNKLDSKSQKGFPTISPSIANNKTNNNKNGLFNLKNFKEMNISSKSSKISDKQRLDNLYKYDDYFKMRMDSIKSKKRVDNLHDYQKEIVIYYLEILIIKIIFYFLNDIFLIQLII